MATSSQPLCGILAPVTHASSDPTPECQAAAAGHFDELRGCRTPEPTDTAVATNSVAPCDDLTRAWGQFFSECSSDGLGDLNQRWANLARHIRDNGVTYNVVAHDGTQQRPWLLGLFPLIIPAQSWQQIVAGITQRARLLEQVMADVYGPQQLLAQGLLPPAVVLGHPGYPRALHGVQPVGGRHLHMVAFDLAHAPDGNWQLVSQHTQAPYGLGYLLENRRAVSLAFLQAFAHLQVQHLAETYRVLMDSLQAQSPAGQDAHIALLTPGPYSASYFEHAYLARYLGVSLVEGSDLVVRDQGLFVKAVHGLVPVHGLLNRLGDAFLDPLELRADSTLGVPGLLQVIRAGKVLVANAPGSAFLESAALLDCLPALSKHLLGAELQMPAATGMPLSQMPTWAPETTDTNNAAPIVPRSVMLRVFALTDGAQGWRVLPGGLAKVAGDGAEVASLQRGGSSADVWVLSSGAAAKASPMSRTASTLAPRQHLVTSRAAENLFWLGRYTERADNSVRLACTTLDTLGGESPSCEPLLNWLGKLAALNILVMPGVPLPTPDVQTRRVFEHALINALGSNQTTSVGYNLRALRLAGAAVRERLSQEHWNLMQRTEDTFSNAGPDRFPMQTTLPYRRRRRSKLLATISPPSPSCRPRSWRTTMAGAC